MRTWDVAVPLDAAADTPLYVQIAEGLGAAVARGRLRAGDALPGTRELAALLGVNRNTVVAAYDELRAQGFTTSSPARATLVSDDWREAPAAAARRSPRRAQAAPGFDLAPPLPALPRPPTSWPKGTLVMQSGVPDMRLLPVDEIARAFRKALKQRGAPLLLGYGDERGHPALRSALARMLAARRGLDVSADDVVVVRGAQMGIDLAARLVIRPGDVVAVEELGYSPAWAALLHAGARLLPVPVDGQGLDVDALARAVAAGGRGSVRMVYVTPHHQYPTTVPLAARRRRALLSLCARERIAILEDDYDHELQYEGRPPLPLAADDDAGVCVYVGTLSKVLAPGLRLGFMAGPPAVVDGAARLRRHVDRQGDLALEAAVADLLDDGTVLRHVRRMRRIYRARRDVLVTALRARLGGALEFDVPRGGMALWAHTPGDVGAFVARARRNGVGVAEARDFALDGVARPYLRMGFASLDEREILEAVVRLAR